MNFRIYGTNQIPKLENIKHFQVSAHLSPVEFRDMLPEPVNSC